MTKKSTLKLATAEFSLASSIRPTNVKKILPMIRQTYFPYKLN